MALNIDGFWAFNGAWRHIGEGGFWVFDGAWQEVTDAWTFDGSSWRKFWEVSDPCEDGSLDTAGTTWGINGGLGCAACAAGYCSYCIIVTWTDCDDACHNIDGALAMNGGSYINSTQCTNKGCSNDSGCDCGAIGQYQFSCELAGKTCALDDDSWQGRLILQKDSDSSTIDTIYGTSKTGACIV